MEGTPWPQTISTELQRIAAGQQSYAPSGVSPVWLAIGESFGYRGTG